jgi:hypothetical protein
MLDQRGESRMENWLPNPNDRAVAICFDESLTGHWLSARRKYCAGILHVAIPAIGESPWDIQI